MTREEAIKILSNHEMIDVMWDKADEALNMAIDALEQQPCEDCISRKASIEAMNKLFNQDCEDYGCEIPECFPAYRAIEELEMLPSVQPIRPKGEWIRWYEIIKYENYEEHDPHCKCSKCNCEVDSYSSQFINFCPTCGADMRGTE